MELDMGNGIDNLAGCPGSTAHGSQHLQIASNRLKCLEIAANGGK